jgi:hypothetical protein
MFTFKNQVKSIKPALVLGTLCLSTLMGAVTISSAQARNETFGLGGSSSSTSGGAVRDGGLPQFLLLVPPDGARTLSAYPTLYFYLSPGENEVKKPFQINFILRETPDPTAKILFRTKVRAKQIGLYRYTLPQDSPSLAERKIQRLQVRFASDISSTSQITILNANVLFDKNPEVIKAVSEAKTGLDKARIFAKQLYWFDALDAYTQWIEANPKDNVAIEERKTLLTQGFKSSKTDPEDNKIEQKQLDEMLSQLLSQLEKDASTRQVMLP